ncbi:type II toxin-antitoxin system prevent-host-death family antitoxin [Pseudidiomarina marina]|uniref:Antitoxin n=1 Tax=Pseudidiomarina marina TaxID=502366 RepID=A0A432YL43_9GAMM|nr:type II toxin-antitoxin system prevent-host-death family antitoxin [Pseudidiomarina marina]RUO61684.1 type II toxin-antitoxin system Phd/YefM family antitoxin [Pseudidiomarina marina]
MYTVKRPRVTTVSGFKKEIATMDVNEPVLVTQNGEPLYVVQDPAQYEAMQEQMAMLKMIALAEKDVRSGRVVSREELFKGLAEELGADDDIN